jgi:nicotinamidase/pyrazinamidase
VISWIIIAGSLLAADALVLGWLSARTNPTKGDKIAEYANPQRAIVIIDVQEDYTGTEAKPPFPYKDSARVIQALNDLPDAAAPRHVLVVYVRHEFGGFLGRAFSKIFSHGTALPGTPGAALDCRLSVGSQPVFTKPTADAFSCAAFETFLIGRRVNELFLAGLDAEYCVRSTARGALARGYKVNVISDGILLLADKRRDALLRQFQRDGARLVASHDCLA